MAEPIFTGPDTWLGGFYELAIELGLRCNERLDRAVQAVWRFPGLQGPFPSRDLEPSEQTLVTANSANLELHGHLRGVATLPSGKAACGTVAVREDDGPDWLDFYFPMGGLSSAYPVGGYPFDSVDHREWREPLEAWLAELGRFVFNAVPFRLGLIGFEASGMEYADDLAASGIPIERWGGYLWPQNGVMGYHATNRWR